MLGEFSGKGLSKATWGTGAIWLPKTVSPFHSGAGRGSASPQDQGTPGCTLPCEGGEPSSTRLGGWGGGHRLLDNQLRKLKKVLESGQAEGWD